MSLDECCLLPERISTITTTEKQEHVNRRQGRRNQGEEGTGEREVELGMEQGRRRKGMKGEKGRGVGLGVLKKWLYGM